jgi:hypothetical protein
MYHTDLIWDYINVPVPKKKKKNEEKNLLNGMALHGLLFICFFFLIIFIFIFKKIF